jgi:hypothetical protein
VCDLTDRSVGSERDASDATSTVLDDRLVGA